MEFKLLMDEAVRDVHAIGGLRWCDSIDEFLVQESFASRLMEQVKALQRNKGLSYLGITDNASLTATLITHFLGRMQWYKHGLQVFDVTDSLLAGLLLTTPTNEPGFPRFPFPSFVIRIPKGFIPIVGSAAVGGLPAWIAYILVNRFQGTSDNPEIVVMAANEGVSHRMNMPEWLHLKRFRSAAHYLREDEARWKQAASEGVGVWHDDWTTQRICMRLIFNLSSWIESMGGMAGWHPEIGKSQEDPDHTMDRGQGSPVRSKDHCVCQGACPWTGQPSDNGGVEPENQPGCPWTHAKAGGGGRQDRAQDHLDQASAERVQ